MDVYRARSPCYLSVVVQVAAGDLEGRLAQMEAQLGQQASAHAAELRQVKERNAEELDKVQARFMQASVVP